MIKICHMTSAHNNDDTRIFYKECCSLKKSGNYDVYLIAPGNTFEKSGVKIIGVNKLDGRFRRMTKTAKSVYKEAIKLDADIYHFHDPELLPYGYKLKKLGKTVIYDSHEDYPLNILEKHWIPSKLRSLASVLITRYEQYISRKLDAVVTVTPQIKYRFDGWNIRTVIVANYPISWDCAKENANAFCEKREVSICFAGCIDHSRLHHNIIAAIENINNIRYNLAGSFRPNIYRLELQSLKGYSKVNYYGQLTHEEIGLFYQDSTIGIVLEDYIPLNYGHEGSLGVTKLFEYMAAGLPVICTDFSIWQNIVEKYNCGICVNPKNIYEIESAIKYFVNNEEMSKIMGRNGLKAIAEKYNWKNEEMKLLKLYSELS